jgi:hypothetical protein
MGTPNEVGEGIDQVRDIIAGPIQRDLERKLARLEAHMLGRFAELQLEVRRRVDVIEGHLRIEAESLGHRIEGELEARSAVVERVAKLEGALTRAERELRTQSLEQAKSFLEEIRRAREEFSETLDRELGSIESGSDVMRPDERPEAGPVSVPH